MENLIYRLIKLKFEEISSLYNIEHKQALSQKKYLFIKPKTEDTAKISISINNKEYKVIDYHFSIYEDLKLKDQRLSTTYHLTINFKAEESEGIITARIYYFEFNKVARVVVKDVKENIINNYNNENFIQLAKSYSSDFINQVTQIYYKLEQQFQDKYNQSIEELTKISKKLHNENTAVEVYKGYRLKLKDTIALVTNWESYQFKKKGSKLPLLSNLQNHIEQQIQQVNISFDAPIDAQEPMEEQEASNVQEQLIVKNKKPSLAQKIEKIKNELDALAKLAARKQVSPSKKTIKEYHLYTQLYNLTDDNDEALDSITKCLELEKTAARQLNECLLLDKKYKEIKNDEIKGLLQIIPIIEPVVYYMAVKMNRLHILKLLLEEDTDFNIDMLFEKTEKRSLLEIAYELKHKAIFELLLENGAFVDRRDKYGDTLLIKACESDREEMVPLLEAGASPMREDISGFTPFGHITMRSKRGDHGRYIHLEPNVNRIKLFLRHAKGLIIDYMQGPVGMKSTPLAFICQSGWLEPAKLMLEHGANPGALREGDMVTPLELAVHKNNYHLCQIILQYSQHDLKGMLTRPLLLAEQRGHTSIQQLFLRYMRENNIQRDDTTLVAILPPNTSNAAERITNYVSNVSLGETTVQLTFPNQQQLRTNAQQAHSLEEKQTKQSAPRKKR